MTIRPARAGEEAELTELAIRSKGHWGHDAAFLERARPELTVRPEHLRRFSGRAQFIVVTHQKRTMEAADWLYGVSMGGDGISKVISRRLATDEPATGTEEPVAAVVR